MTLPEFVFLRPWWLVVPPLVLGLAYILHRRGNGGDWMRAIDPPLLQALERRGAFKGGGTALPVFPLWLIVAALIALALAGPAVRNETGDSFRNLDGVIVALDASKSMADSGSMAAGQIAAMQMIEASAASQQVALILYAGDAYAGSFFSADRQLLRPLLGGNLGDIVAEQGSDPARAMAMAQEMFSDAAMIGGDLVVVTDGGGVDPAALQAAKALRDAGRRVNVLFVSPTATDPNMPLPDRAGAARMAAEGGGVFADIADPSPLLSALDAPLDRKLERNGYAALAWLDLGRYMLVLAAAPLLMLFGRRI